MSSVPKRLVLKAFVIRGGRYYGLAINPIRRENALKFLGTAEEGDAAVAAGVDKAWHDSALALLNAPPDAGAADADDGGNGGVLEHPWYLVFETEANQNEAGDLWAGRFFEEGRTELNATANEGVFAIFDDTAPDELDGKPFLLAQPVRRFVVLESRADAGDNVQASNHGGDEDGILIDW